MMIKNNRNIMPAKAQFKLISNIHAIEKSLRECGPFPVLERGALHLNLVEILFEITFFVYFSQSWSHLRGEGRRRMLHSLSISISLATQLCVSICIISGIEIEPIDWFDYCLEWMENFIWSIGYYAMSEEWIERNTIWNASNSSHCWMENWLNHQFISNLSQKRVLKLTQQRSQAKKICDSKKCRLIGLAAMKSVWNKLLIS